MKTTINVFFLLLCCTKLQAQTFELESNGKDTVNVIDHKGNKRGLWITRSAGYGSVPLEKGIYKNNRKEGVWEEYYKNGKMRSKLTYSNGVLEGPAAFYNTDGKVMKEGSFKGNKWVQ